MNDDNRADRIAAVLDGRARYTVLCARVEDVEPLLPDGSASLMPTDGPYHGVKTEQAWDTEHASVAAFLAWKRERYAAWRRILAPNGTLLDFASNEMGARVEVAMREYFEVLANIRWTKRLSRANATERAVSRRPFPAGETIIMAEQRGSDSLALAESQYGVSCDRLRAAVFEPIRAYLDGERERCGVSLPAIDAEWKRERGNKGGMSGHWFGRSQWALPTAANYAWLRDVLTRLGGSHEPLRREYEELRREYEELRREYEELRREYEGLRRYFNADEDGVPHTDVWTYETVVTYDGKHPCEKPPAMCRDIVRMASRPNDVVLVLFAGAGGFAAEAVAQGRRAIAVEADPYWAARTDNACAAAVERGFVDVKATARTTPRPGSDDGDGRQLRLL